MPAGYVKMRNAFKKKGLSDKKAKKKAAMIWNSKHKSNPVTRHESTAGYGFDYCFLNGETTAPREINSKPVSRKKKAPFTNTTSGNSRIPTSFNTMPEALIDTGTPGPKLTNPAKRRTAAQTIKAERSSARGGVGTSSEKSAEASAKMADHALSKATYGDEASSDVYFKAHKRMGALSRKQAERNEMKKKAEQFAQFMEEYLNEVSPKHPVQEPKIRKSIATTINISRNSERRSPEKKSRANSRLATIFHGANMGAQTLGDYGNYDTDPALRTAEVFRKASTKMHGLSMKQLAKDEAVKKG